MEILHGITRLGFYLVTLVTLGAAVLVVSARNIFHSALALVLALLGVAGTYVYLRAEFLAVIQILLYVGAIMTLVIFAIMLTSRIGDGAVLQNNRQSLLSFALLVIFNLFFIAGTLQTTWNWNRSSFMTQVDAKALGLALMQEYVFPFEIISVVLIVAMVGAIIVGRQDQ